MSSFTSFVNRATRPVLIATAIVTTTPVVIFFCAAIARIFQSPTQPSANRLVLVDDGLGIEFFVILLFLLALATFIVAWLIALTWYFIRRTWQHRELRRIGERFGWTPQQK